MSAWKALSGRISLMARTPTPLAGAAVLDYYRCLWGDTAQNFQQAPNPLLPSTAQGFVGDMLVTCSTGANRVDFNFSPRPSPTPDLTLRLLEHAGALLQELSRVATAIGSKTLKVPEGFNNVALYVQFVNIQPAVTAANSVIVRAIPQRYRVELSEEEGFILQVSNPVPVPNITKRKLHLVTKWSVEQFHVVTFGMAVGGPPGAPQPGAVITPQVSIHIGASVSFDCVTTTPFGPLTHLSPQETLSNTEQSAMLLAALELTEKLQRDYGLDVEGYVGDHTTH
jgi:hypothetical protein